MRIKRTVSSFNNKNQSLCDTTFFLEVHSNFRLELTDKIDANNGLTKSQYTKATNGLQVTVRLTKPYGNAIITDTHLSVGSGLML